MKKILFGIALIVVIVVTIFNRNTAAPIEESVKMKTVEVGVVGEFTNDSSNYSLVGRVQSIEQVNIKAEVSGVVKEIDVAEGQVLEVGKTIASFDHEQLDTRVKQTQGALSAARGQFSAMSRGARAEELQILQLQLDAAGQRLQQLKKGARQEEIVATKINLSNTEKSLADAKKILTQTEAKSVQDRKTIRSNTIYVIQSAATVADRAMGTHLLDIVIEGNNPADCRYNFISSASRANEQGKKCIDAFAAKEALYDLSDNLNDSFSSDGDISQKLFEAESKLNLIQQYLEVTFYTLDRAVGHVGNQSLSSQEMATYKNSVLAAQSEIEGMINQINNQKQASETQRLNSDISLSSAEVQVHELESRFASLEQELKIKQTGATAEELAIQQSQIDQLRLQLSLANMGAGKEELIAQQGMVTQAYAQLENSQLEREKAIFRAPFKGQVLSLPIKIGDYINIGSTVAVFGNADSLEIITYISDKESGFVEVGETVQLETPHGYTEGVIYEIAPSIDPVLKKIKLTIHPKEITKKLTIGSTIRVKFEGMSAGLQIPLTAVKFKGKDAYVLSVDESNMTHALDVILGNTYGDMIEVRQGLNLDTRIIKDARGIQDGEVVTFQ